MIELSKVRIWTGWAITVFPAIASGELTGRLAYNSGNDTIRTGYINNGILGSISTVPLPITYGGGPAQWSPDGEYLTFSAGSRINVVRPDGSDFRAVTDGSVGDQVEPDFSPDGLQIVFHGVYGNIYTVSSTGTNNAPTNTGVPGGHTRWSPTGNKIVFTDWGFTYDSDMFVRDLDTSTTFQITFHTPGVDAFNRADWSPDGTKLAVNRLNKATDLYDVYLIDVTDLANPGTPVNLTGDMPGSDENSPTWSLDGQYIVFASNSAGSWDIWAMKADGSQKINLTNTLDVNETSPAIASAKLTGRLAYSSAGNATIRTGCINNGILGSISTVPSSITSGQPAQWSPDGEYLTFSGGPVGGSRINVVRPDGSDFRTVTDGSVVNQVEPDFSPDGSQIVFHGVYGNIYTVNSAGTNNAPTNTGVPGGHTRWSPTGNRIVFTDWGFTYDSDMFVRDLDTSTTFQITFHAPGVDAFNRADWSPDGTKLAVNRLNKATDLYDVYLIDVTDLANPGTPVNLTGDMPGSDENSPTWSLDGQYIVFASNSDGSSDIWAMKADGSQKINLTNTLDVNETSPAIGFPGTDTDGDGVGDLCDNCVSVVNPNQSNIDGDAFGDVCDQCPFDPSNTKVDGNCIPTLSEWGMMAMAGLMLLAGAVVIGRRKKALGIGH